MFAENLTQFSMRWCTFLEEDLSDSYKHSLQRMPWSQKKHNGVCKWILNNLKWCWNLLAEGTIFFWVCIRVEGLFQTITTALFLQTDTSKGMHKVRSQFLSGISCFLKNTTWDHRYWRIVCKNKCRTHVLYFVSIFGIVFETRQILQNTRWK